MEPPKSTISISEQQPSGASIAQEVGKLVGIHISIGDTLPQTICLKCYDELKVCIGFREKALKSDLFLRGS